MEIHWSWLPDVYSLHCRLSNCRPLQLVLHACLVNCSKVKQCYTADVNSLCGLQDPGNLEGDLQAGANTGYILLWVLVWSTVMVSHCNCACGQIITV